MALPNRPNACTARSGRVMGTIACHEPVAVGRCHPCGCRAVNCSFWRHIVGGRMKLPQTGGCQCGSIRYEITEAPQLVYTCHCTDCQPMTSSAFSMGVALPANAF